MLYFYPLNTQKTKVFFANFLCIFTLKLESHLDSSKYDLFNFIVIWQVLSNYPHKWSKLNWISMCSYLHVLKLNCITSVFGSRVTYMKCATKNTLIWCHGLYITMKVANNAMLGCMFVTCTDKCKHIMFTVQADHHGTSTRFHFHERLKPLWYLDGLFLTVPAIILQNIF